MTEEQYGQKVALAKMMSKDDFNYKDALIKMIYNYKYGNGLDKIDDISYAETDSEIEIRIGKFFIKEITLEINDTTYRRAYESLINFLIKNTVKP